MSRVDDRLPLAASVLLLRQPATGDGPFELYMLRRPDAARFAPGAYIFPGGVLDDADRVAVPTLFGPEAQPALERLRARMAVGGPAPAPDRETSAALLVTAARELFEESGVLIARHRDGRAADLADQVYWQRHRDDLLGGARGFADLLAAEGLTIAPDDLVYFSHWITPRGLRLRFDTHFFLATLPPGQRASHFAGELAEGLWLTAAEGLRRHAAGDFPLVPVQTQHLARLAGFASLAGLLAFARAKPVRAVLPELGRDGVTLPEEVRECW